jgi:NADH dehydrogenase FAD-containing subunit
MEETALPIPVVVAGAGPTGLWLACELALARGAAGCAELLTKPANIPQPRRFGIHLRLGKILALLRALSSDLLSGRLQ